MKARLGDRERLEQNLVVVLVSVTQSVLALSLDAAVLVDYGFHLFPYVEHRKNSFWEKAKRGGLHLVLILMRRKQFVQV